MATDEDREAQDHELLALESIYDRSVFQRREGERGGQICVSVDVSSSVSVQIQPESLAASDPVSACTPLAVRHLPPIVLAFQFPEDYPSKRPPSYSLTCKWLSRTQLTTLCTMLDGMAQDMCDAGVVVLFQWIQLLSDETLSSFGRTNDSDSTICLTVGSAEDRDGLDNRTMQDIRSVEALRRALFEYNEEQEEMVFKKSSYDCEVCFTSHPGTECLRFTPCRHVFCHDCVRSYFEVQIADGEVRSLCCPTLDCESQALPTQVKSLVSSDKFAQYDRLLLQRSLDEMSDVAYCPVVSCQHPVLREKDSMMGVCGQCRYVFCVLCRRVWHGVAPCRLLPKDQQALCETYEKGTPEERAALKARYGEATIKRVVEEVVSEKWLSENSKNCPSCGAHIQRTEGCNVMTCRHCRVPFCWICLKQLGRVNPYRHFGDSASPCYNKLFEGTDNIDWD